MLRTRKSNKGPLPPFFKHGEYVRSEDGQRQIHISSEMLRWDWVWIAIGRLCLSVGCLCMHTIRIRICAVDCVSVRDHFSRPLLFVPSNKIFHSDSSSSSSNLPSALRNSYGTKGEACARQELEEEEWRTQKGKGRKALLLLRK